MANLKPIHALNLDVNQQKSFIKYFSSLSLKPQTTVRFFDRSDYYSVHGEDADLAAKFIFKSTSYIKTMAPTGTDMELPYLVLSKVNFENIVRELLLVKNYRVEVYTNNGPNKASNDWSLDYRGSPGNLLQFEELLFSNNEMICSSTIMGLTLKKELNQMLVGIACVDINDRTFFVMEFFDDDFFAELEATVVLLGPKECLLPSSDGDFVKVKELMERNGVMITIRKKKDFTIEKSILIQDLNKLLRFEKGQQESANTIPEINKTFAMGALGSCIKYLDICSDSDNMGQFEMKLLDLNRFVHLDSAAITALNIFPKSGTPMNSSYFKWNSILGVLDRCRTAQGHRLMSQWLKQPLRDEATIKDRHDIVECLVDSITVRKELHDDYLLRLPDIMMIGRKLLKKKASLQDIYKLYQVVLRIPKLLSIFLELDNSTVKSVLYEPMKDSNNDMLMFKKMVEQIMDLDLIEKGEYFIKPSFDDQLEETKDKMNKLEQKMEKQLDKAADDLQLDRGSSIKLDTVSHIGYHFRISLKDDSILRKNNKYNIIDAIKGGVRFTTDRLKELNADFNEVKLAYEEQQKSIVEEVVRTSIGYLQTLSSINYQIAQLDCLVSFAVAAVTAPIPYIRPKMLSEGKGILNLKDLRHPCLELQEGVTYIANDVNFKRDETQMYIITGPNMGGKSTYIRSVGTAVLMAHIGSFVPCSEAEISIVDSIFGRVGAGDCLIKGLSTFMIEMIETSAIIRAATKNSLIIIDELGRGTSTYEGCGIAWSIAEYLAKQTKCFTLFATHFHEITELAQTNPTVKNCHMVAIADKENFTLLYQVRLGIMDKSFGIHVAKLANFPEDVVNLAQKLYDESEDHYSQLKSENDEEATKLFLDAVEKFTTIDNAKDNEIIKIMDDIRSRVKLSDSEYFKATFPQLFE